MHKLFCIMGRTASGKSSLAKSLTEIYSKMTQLKSYTTRPPRSLKDRVEGDHIFVSELDYENIYKSDVVAYTEIKGAKYFATAEQLYTSDIYVIDPDGVNYLKKQNLEDLEIVTIYVNCGDRELRKQRFLLRDNAKEEDFEARDLSEDEQFSTFELEGECDYDVDNSFDTYDALMRLVDIIDGEKED